MKKKIVITGIVMIIIIAIAVVIMLIKNKQINYEILEIKDFKYAILEKDGKYGVIDKQGNTIIEPEYNIVQIPNPEKPVFICYYDYSVEDNIYKTKVLNEKNEEMFSEYSQVCAIPIKSSHTDVLYEKSVLKFQKDEKYGLIDFNGKQIVEPKYDDIKSLDYKEGIILTKNADKYGAINVNGYEIIKPEYDYIISDNYYDEETYSKKAGFIVRNTIQDGYRYGYINYKGKKILDTKYNKIERIKDIDDEKNVYLIASMDGQAGVLKNNKIIIKHEYVEIGYNSINNLFEVQKAEKYGVINIKGDYILPIDYDEIMFSGIYLIANKSNTKFTFDAKGNKIQDAKYINVTPVENEKYFITVDTDDYYGVINKEGKEIVKNNYSYIEYLYDNYFIATKGGKTGIINDEEKYITEFKYSNITKIKDTRLLKLETDIDVSIMTDKMQEIVSMENGMVQRYNDYIKVYSENDVKYINLEGKEVQNKDIYTNNQLFAKKSDGKWGFVNKNGDWIIQPTYDFVTEFENKVAGVKKDSKWGIINENGEFIKEPIYTIKNIMPKFIGKYYNVEESYTYSYYTERVVEGEKINE